MKRIGKNYWYLFLSRNEKMIRSKKGRKFELDRSNWTKYGNFKNMYCDVEVEMIDAGIATKLPSPVSCDSQGKLVDEIDGVGMKVKVKLNCPDMCVVLDEVDCNLNMTKDGHTGGTKFVVGRDMEAKTKATKHEKHFTCLGLTALSGEPIMCVIIVDKKREDFLIRTGVDVSQDVIFDDSQNKVTGEVLHDRIYKIPKITAVSLIITGKTHTFGKHVRDLVKERVEEKRKETQLKREREIEIYRKKQD
jgi:hypothetical protein